MWFRKIKAGLVKDDIREYIGEQGNLFFNVETGEIRLSDGITLGGIAIAGGSGSYTLPTASTMIKGGVRIDGTTIKITNDVIRGFSGVYEDLTNKPQIPQTLNDLQGFDISAPQPHDVLIYNGVFKNTDIKLHGGTVDQILVKKSSEDYDYSWEDMIINLPEKTYTRLLDQASDTVLYLGEALPNTLEHQAAWRIQKIIFDLQGNVQEIRYAGQGYFTEIWNDRLTLTYS